MAQKLSLYTDFVSEPQKVLISPVYVMYTKKVFFYLLINLTEARVFGAEKKHSY